MSRPFLRIRMMLSIRQVFLVRRGERAGRYVALRVETAAAFLLSALSLLLLHLLPFVVGAILGDHFETD